MRWLRIDVPYETQTRAGYYAERTVDVHLLESLYLSKEDLEAMRELGVAIGLQTNVGTLWAQEPGRNFRMEREP